MFRTRKEKLHEGQVDEPGQKILDYGNSIFLTRLRFYLYYFVTTLVKLHLTS